MEIYPASRVHYVGVNDPDITLFEGQYPVPQGVSYNAYVLMDDYICVFDSVDARKTDAWLENLDEVLKGARPDYLMISHMEPDHAGSLAAFAKKYPETTFLGSAKALAMCKQFFPYLQNPTQVVKEPISLGHVTLHFLPTPMVHWPEVVMTYVPEEQLLFSADAFGKFGTVDGDLTDPGNWLPEARRYFINIVGKYGMQVQNVLKKAGAFELQTICPLHGPVLTGDLAPYLELYDIWSSYRPETRGVCIAVASIYGHTAEAARYVETCLRAAGEDVVYLDLDTCDKAEAVAQAFRMDRLVLCASSYDGGVFPPMEEFLLHLRAKNFQNRAVFLVENGTWAPSAAKTMHTYLDNMKNLTVSENTVTLKSAVHNDDLPKLRALADEVHAYEA